MKIPLIEPLEARIAPATLSIVSPGATAEGDAGSHQLDFIVSLSGDITTPVTVNFATANGTATTADADYTATNGTLTFQPGETQMIVHVPILGDTKFELDETFTVTLAAPTGDATLDPDASTATGTITNDDAVPTVSILDNAAVSEGALGISNAPFTVRLSNPSFERITLAVTTSDGTAMAGTDYTALNTTLSFEPGETSKTVSVTIRGDNVDEPDETFFVNLAQPATPSNVILGKAQATGTIRNNDISISVSDPTPLREGNSGDTIFNFTVSLTAVSTHSVMVDFATADGSALATGANADYVAQAGTLTFAPGVTSQSVQVVVHGDQLSESNETFFLNLSNARDATIIDSQGVATILNDDTALRIEDVRLIEGPAGGTTFAVFKIKLDQGPSNSRVLVDVATMDDTAGSLDYTALAPTTLTFLPGQLEKTIAVPVFGDSLAEGNEAFFAKLSNARLLDPSGATLPLAGAIVRDTATATIIDGAPNVVVSDVTITEGDRGTANANFVVRLLSAPTAEFTVNVSTANGSAVSDGPNADFAATTQTLTFAPSGVLTQVFSVPIRGDLVREGAENFRVLLETTSENVTTLQGSAVGTILDNGDTAPIASIANQRFIEGDSGTLAQNFTVTLSHPAEDFVTVNFSTKDGTGQHPAIAGSDYVAIPAGTVTFAPGQTTAQIAVPIIGDTADEFDETFTVTLDSATGAALGASTARGTIANDDVLISIDDQVVTEGFGGADKTFSFEVKLNRPATHEVKVDFATVDGTAISTGANRDFFSKAGTLTFPAGSTSQVIKVKVLDDRRIELDEDFYHPPALPDQCFARDRSDVPRSRRSSTTTAPR